jgi:3',5'-cyclic AMP phosphodiesterase CpdA
MKIIQVTDVHLGRRGEIRYGANLHERLDGCIDHINARHGDAALCVFSGDLTETGAPESYADLKSALSRLSLPYRLLPGNHDRRANLVAAFPENPTDDNGFVQSVVDTSEVSLLLLDSSATSGLPGSTRGSLRRRDDRPISSCITRRSSSACHCSTRLGWNRSSVSSRC